MKTKKEFLKNTFSPKLTNAVIKQIGLDFKELKECANDFRDASRGVSGFIYYIDTHKFALKNRKEIVMLLEEQAAQFDTNVIDMIKGFEVFNGKIDNDELKDLYLFLGGAKNIKQGTVTNVLSWFALEETIYNLVNYLED